MGAYVKKRKLCFSVRLKADELLCTKPLLLWRKCHSAGAIWLFGFRVRSVSFLASLSILCTNGISSSEKPKDTIRTLPSNCAMRWIWSCLIHVSNLTKSTLSPFILKYIPKLMISLSDIPLFSIQLTFTTIRSRSFSVSIEVSIA